MTLAQTCNNAAEHATFTFSGTQYIKLKDGNCWTKNSVGTMTSVDYASTCPAGADKPTRSAIIALVSAYAETSLGSITGWSGAYSISVGTLTNNRNYFFIGSTMNASPIGWAANFANGIDAWAGYTSTSLLMANFSQVKALCLVVPSS